MPRELNQQGILVKSKIPTPKEMMQIDKMDEKKKVAREKKIAITEKHSSKSISLVSLYDIDFENENSNDASG